MTNIPRKIELGDLYGIRLLIFLEVSPQSNKYHQLYFTQEQFKEISLKVGDVIAPKDERHIETVKLEVSEDVYDLPDLQQVNE